jgi:lysophospholipase L1-like esterase
MTSCGKRPVNSRARRIVGSLLLLVLSVCVAGALGELILRLLGHHGEPVSPISNIYAVDDPILDWRYVPNSRLVKGGIVNAHNSLGFRDVEHSVDNPKGRTRVIVVGDSVAEGYGVNWDSVFAHIVQSELGDEFEVINLAMQGLNSPQEVHLLEGSGLAYKPDVVVLSFVLNDSDFFTSFKAARRFTAEKDATLGMLNIRVNPRMKRLLKSSAFVYFVKERTEYLIERVSGNEQADYFTRLWASEANRQRVKDAFDRLKVLHEEHGFTVVIVIWPLLTAYGDYRFTAIHAWVREQARSRGLQELDLLPSFAAVSYRRLQVTAGDNVHPNALGHRIAAEAFLTWYRSSPTARRDSIH